jgi:hypothetical protein
LKNQKGKSIQKGIHPNFGGSTGNGGIYGVSLQKGGSSSGGGSDAFFKSAINFLSSSIYFLPPTRTENIRIYHISFLYEPKLQGDF